MFLCCYFCFSLTHQFNFLLSLLMYCWHRKFLLWQWNKIVMSIKFITRTWWPQRHNKQCEKEARVYIWDVHYIFMSVQYLHNCFIFNIRIIFFTSPKYALGEPFSCLVCCIQCLNILVRFISLGNMTVHDSCVYHGKPAHQTSLRQNTSGVRKPHSK